MKVQDVSAIYQKETLRFRPDWPFLFCLLLSVILLIWPGITVRNNVESGCFAAQVVAGDSIQARILEGELAGAAVKLTEDAFWNASRLPEGEKLFIRIHTDDKGQITGAEVLDYFWTERFLILGIFGLLLIFLLGGRRNRPAFLTLIPGILLIWKLLFPSWLSQAAGQDAGSFPEMILVIAPGLTLLFGAVLLLIRNGFSKRFLMSVTAYAVSILLIILYSAVFGRIRQPGTGSIGSLFLGAMLLCGTGAMTDMIQFVFDGIRRSVRWQPGIRRREAFEMGMLSARNHQCIVGLIFLISGLSIALVLWMLYTVGGELTETLPQGKYLAEEILNAMLLAPAFLLSIPCAAAAGAVFYNVKGERTSP